MRIIKYAILLFLAVNCVSSAGQWRVIHDFNQNGALLGATRCFAGYDSLRFGVMGYHFTKIGNTINNFEEYFSGTQDGGKTWNYKVLSSLTDTTQTAQQFFNLNYLSQKSILTIGDGARIYKSIDGGLTWNNCLIGKDSILQEIDFKLCDNKKNGALLLNSEDLFLTKDSCKTWNLTKVDFKFSSKNYYAEKVFNFDDTLVFIHYTNRGNFYQKLLVSKDNFKTYDVLDLKNGGNSALKMMDSKLGFLSFLDTSKASNEAFSIYKTIDGGKTWKETLLIGEGIKNHINFFNFISLNKNEINATSYMLLGHWKSVDNGDTWEYQDLSKFSDTSKITNGRVVGYFSIQPNLKFLLTKEYIIRYIDDESSVDETQIQTSVEVYPMPLYKGGTVNIKCDLQNNDDALVLIYDITGTIISNFNTSINSGLIQFAMPQAPSGSYNVLIKPSSSAAIYTKLTINN